MREYLVNTYVSILLSAQNSNVQVISNARVITRLVLLTAWFGDDQEPVIKWSI